MEEETRRWIEILCGPDSKDSLERSGKFPHPPPSWFQSPPPNASGSLSDLLGLSLPPQPDPPPQQWYPTYLSRYVGTQMPPASYAGLQQALKNWAADYVAKNRPPEPEPVKKTGPIVGFRAWEIEDDVKGPRLASTGINDCWWPEGKALRAKCAALPATAAQYHDESMPGYRCTCGFYARRSLGNASRSFNVSARFAYGAVLLWGRLIAHFTAANPSLFGDLRQERELTGWRAEWARPLALLDTAVFQDNPDLDKLSERYQIPVLDRRSLLLYCAEYGEIV